MLMREQPRYTVVNRSSIDNVYDNWLVYPGINHTYLLHWTPPEPTVYGMGALKAFNAPATLVYPTEIAVVTAKIRDKLYEGHLTSVILGSGFPFFIMIFTYDNAPREIYYAGQGSYTCPYVGSVNIDGLSQVPVQNDELMLGSDKTAVTDLICNITTGYARTKSGVLHGWGYYCESMAGQAYKLTGGVTNRYSISSLHQPYCTSVATYDGFNGSIGGCIINSGGLLFQAGEVIYAPTQRIATFSDVPSSVYGAGTYGSVLDITCGRFSAYYTADGYTSSVFPFGVKKNNSIIGKSSVADGGVVPTATEYRYTGFIKEQIVSGFDSFYMLASYMGVKYLIANGGNYKGQLGTGNLQAVTGFITKSSQVQNKYKSIVTNQATTGVYIHRADGLYYLGSNAYGESGTGTIGVLPNETKVVLP